MSSSSLTSREVVIAVVPKITGGLSMVGSGWIAYQVLSDRQKRHKTYHRLLVLLSCCDIVSSASYFCSTWPIPQGINVGWQSPYHYQAIGNDATCTAQGFGIQFGLTTAFLNIMLALHYLLVIKFNHTESSIQSKEPYMWFTALTLGLAFSVPGLFLQIYNNSNLWCWISPNWSLCEQQGLTRDQCVDQTYRYRWIFYYGPLWTAIGLICLAQLWLWWTVRQMEVRVSKWRPTDSKAIRMRQSRRVAIQSAWYMAVFIVTWLPYTAIAMTGKYFNPHDTTGFVVLLFVVTCQPIQGALNVFVYHRHSIARASSRTAAKLAKSAHTTTFGDKISSKNNNNQNNNNKHQRKLDQLREDMRDLRLTTVLQGPQSMTMRELHIDIDIDIDMEMPSNSSSAPASEQQEQQEKEQELERLEDQSTTHFEDETTTGEPTREQEEAVNDLHDIYD